VSDGDGTVHGASELQSPGRAEAPVNRLLAQAAAGVKSTQEQPETRAPAAAPTPTHAGPRAASANAPAKLLPTSWLGNTFTLASQLAARGLSLPFKPDELYRVPTSDGAAIALGRYRPRGDRLYAEPVILCHGLGANRYSFDFDERYSLARYLARRGFEAWVLELRGRGLSGPPIDATFDEQAEHDVGAAIRTVLSTGADAVTWVGHSKGGLLLYAHLALNRSAPVKAAVSIGTPGSFAHQPGLKRFVHALNPALRLPVIPLERLAKSMAYFGLPPAPVGPYLVRAANMEPDVIRRAIANVAADVPGGVARQFAQWVVNGRFTSEDGRVDYFEALGELSLPLLLIAGSHDLLAPPDSVLALQRQVKGRGEVVIAGKAHGFEEDYGHGDLLLGRKAPDELFPRVAAFLAGHSTAG
jgi:pimeloyl-ACP methyl ester carboxylesterase